VLNIVALLKKKKSDVALHKALTENAVTGFLKTLGTCLLRFSHRFICSLPVDILWISSRMLLVCLCYLFMRSLSLRPHRFL